MRKIISAFILTSAVLAATPAHAMTYYLVDQWLRNGDRMCMYGNGSVLNVGYRVCPLSIQG